MTSMPVLPGSSTLPDSNTEAVSAKLHELSWTNDVDLEEKLHEHGNHSNKKKSVLSLLLLSFSTLGVVYGDIGTSPLYVYASIYPNGAPDDEKLILGAFSMIFWTITVVVLIKYVLIMLRADDNGEGGIISLYSLIKRAAGVPTLTHLQNISGEDTRLDIQRKSGKISRAIGSSLHKSNWQQITLLIIVLLGVNMIISDGVLTPAISVISAVEGIQYNTHISRDAVIGITIAILVVLFMSQRFGTAKISFLFSPIILLWLLGNFIIGAYNFSTYPAVIKGLSPSYIYWYWSGQSTAAWKTLGSIFLSITGAEALYADLGHFNAKAIQLSFIGIVYPSLIFTYLGQTAYLIQHKADSPVAFWASIPHAVYIPMVVFAALAAIIASQALITGAFSITKHGMALRCFPRFTIHHTSSHHEGQVYIPEINYLLMVGSIVIVVAFKDSLHIGNAYGLSIVIVMMVDTFLLSLVMLMYWNWHPILVGSFFLVYSFISATYLSSLVEKIPHGAWFSLVVSGILSIISFVYWWGRAQKAAYIRENIVQLGDLFEPAKGGGNHAGAAGNNESNTNIGDQNVSQSAPLLSLRTQNGSYTHDDNGDTRTSTESALTVQLFSGIKPLRFVGTKLPVARLPGLGIYYSETLNGIPPVLVRFLSLSPAIHEAVVFVTIRCVLLPVVPDEERLLVRKLNVEGFYHIVARYGYMETINQGPEFVKLVVDELLEYLQTASMDDSMHLASTILELDEEVGNVTGGSNSITSAITTRGYGVNLHRVSDNMMGADDSTYTVNTQIARRMYAQIQAKLRGETDPEGGGQEKASGTTKISQSTVKQQKQENSSSSQRHWPQSQTQNAVSGTAPGTDIPVLPGQGGPIEYPWVAQPSVLSRTRSSRVRFAKSKSMFEQRDATTTVPLPLPPPRPLLHRFSNPIPVTTSHGNDASGLNSNTVTIEISPMRTPSSSIAGRNAQLLLQRLQEERAKVEEAAVAEAQNAAVGDKFAQERQLLLSAYANGVVYLLGRGEVRGKSDAKGFGARLQRFILNGPYSFLVRNSRPASSEYCLPTDSLLEMKMRYEI